MICPHCGEKSFPKKKNIVENWKLVGCIEVCALCGKELPGGEKSGNAPAESKRAALSALLGGELPEKCVLAGQSSGDFCHNCAHFIEHPFRTLCGISGDEADPMSGCDKFEMRGNSVP